MRGNRKGFLSGYAFHNRNLGAKIIPLSAEVSQRSQKKDLRVDPSQVFVIIKVKILPEYKKPDMS